MALGAASVAQEPRAARAALSGFKSMLEYAVVASKGWAGLLRSDRPGTRVCSLGCVR